MKTVLIADDSVFMLTWLSNIIQSKRTFKVIASVQNGLDAVDQYKKTNPDITLLDIHMPGANGLMALKEILEYDANAKVIMCSSVGSKIQVIETIKLGAKDFVVKPYFHQLIDKMERLVT